MSDTGTGSTAKAAKSGDGWTPSADGASVSKTYKLGATAEAAKLLENIAVIGFYNLPLDYLDRWIGQVRAVSVSDVRAALRRHVHPEQLVTVIVGEDARDARPASAAP